MSSIKYHLKLTYAILKCVFTTSSFETSVVWVDKDSRIHIQKTERPGHE